MRRCGIQACACFLLINGSIRHAYTLCNDGSGILIDCSHSVTDMDSAKSHSSNTSYLISHQCCEVTLYQYHASPVDLQQTHQIQQAVAQYPVRSNMSTSCKFHDTLLLAFSWVISQVSVWLIPNQLALQNLLGNAALSTRVSSIKRKQTTLHMLGIIPHDLRGI